MRSTSTGLPLLKWPETCHISPVVSFFLETRCTGVCAVQKFRKLWE